MTGKEFFLECEKERIHCVVWTPEGQVRAVLHIVHGMLEYALRYEPFASFMCENGIAVVGHDHPGHGLSVSDESLLGYMPKGGHDLMVAFTKTVNSYIKSEFEGIPVILLGHSMGSFVARRYICSYSESVDGAIIVGTANMPLGVVKAGRALAGLLGKLKGDKNPAALLEKLSFAGYNKKFPKSEGPHAWISSDRAVVQKYDSDPYCSYPFKIGGYKALYESLISLAKKEGFDNIRKDLSLLITAGEEDPVGSYGKGPTQCFEIYRYFGLKDCTLKLYKGMRHEIINEREREMVFADLIGWINSKIQK